MEGWKEEGYSYQDILDGYLFKNLITEQEYDKLTEAKQEDNKPPKTILPSPRLFDNLEMWKALFQANTPTQFPIRFKRAMTVYYSIGDVSRKGFGNMLEENKASSLDILISRWSVEEE